MKCPKCDDKGKVLDYVAERNCHGEWETVLREIPCDKCQRKPMTNEEWLHTLNTEEKAFALETIIRSVLVLRSPMCHDVCNREFWERWLKEKHDDL